MTYLGLLGFRWTPWGVESALTDSDAASKFKQRATYDYVVLFDEDSYEKDLSSDHCLQGLKQAIYSVRILKKIALMTIRYRFLVRSRC